MTSHSVGLSPAPEYLYPERPATVPTGQPVPESAAVSADPAPATEPSATGSVASTEKREQSNRVEVIGRVGWEPKYREFQSGNARLQFSVSQAMEDGSTRWHTVKAFKERARRYKDAIHKGDAVHLVGGRATETYKDKQGNEREREFLILWGLKPLGNSTRG